MEAMSEHLPECPVEKRLRDGNTVGSQTCICEALRACEKRMLATLKRTQTEVESELDDSGYGMFKEFKKEVFGRVRDAYERRSDD
jgi:hypothetical protein